MVDSSQKIMTFGDLNEKCNGRLSKSDLNVTVNQPLDVWNKGCTFMELMGIDRLQGKWVTSPDYKPSDGNIVLLNSKISVSWPYTYSFDCSFTLNINAKNLSTMPGTGYSTPSIGIYTTSSGQPNINATGNRVTKVGTSQHNIFPNIPQSIDVITNITARIANTGTMKWSSFIAGGTWMMYFVSGDPIGGKLQGAMGGSASLSLVELQLDGLSNVDFTNDSNIQRLEITFNLSEN